MPVNYIFKIQGLEKITSNYNGCVEWLRHVLYQYFCSFLIILKKNMTIKSSEEN